MSDTNHTIPARLQEIVEDFELCEGREKLELLLQYSDSLPPLPDWLLGKRERMDQVHECMTPVFVYAENKNGRLSYHFDIPPESPTVRGYAEVLRAGLEGTMPQEVVTVPLLFFHEMGLQKVLTPQRLNGIGAILAHMQRLAVAELD